MLTHKMVETLTDDFMGPQRWVRVRIIDRRISHKRGQYISAPQFNGRRPDRLYIRDDQVLATEIKPENTSEREVMTGIGQLACLLPYQVKVYLVISVAAVERFSPVFDQLPWLGIFQYIPMAIVRKSERGDMSSLIKLPPFASMQTSRLTRELLWDFLVNHIHRDGKYGIEFLISALEEVYPSITIHQQTLGRLLNSMGFERDPNVSSVTPGLRGKFNIAINRRIYR